MSAQLALFEAVVAKLRASSALTARIANRIHDGVPQNAVMPYLRVAIDTVREGTDLENDIESITATITIDIFSNAVGSVEARRIAADVETALHRASLTLSGYEAQNIQHRTTLMQADPDPKVTHGIAIFEALVEQT